MTDEQTAYDSGSELDTTIDQAVAAEPMLTPIEVEDRGGTKMMRAIGRPVLGTSTDHVAQMNSIRHSAGTPQGAGLPEAILIARRNVDNVTSLDEVDTTLGYTYHWSGPDHGTFMDARYVNPRRAMATLRKTLRASLAGNASGFPHNIRVGHVVRKSMHDLAADPGTREIRILWIVSEAEARQLLRIVDGALGT